MNDLLDRRTPSHPRTSAVILSVAERLNVRPVRIKAAQMIGHLKPWTGWTVRNVSGATAIEYGLIAALIVIVILGAVATVGSNVGSLYNFVSNHANNALAA